MSACLSAQPGHAPGTLHPVAAAARLVAGGALVAALVGMPTVHAQTSAPPTAGEATLPSVQVKAATVRDDRTEGSGSFTAGSSSAATGLPLTLRETPQSVTVITRERMDQAGITSLGDALAQTPGIDYRPAGSPLGGYATLNSRGYEVNSLILDGVPVPVAAIAGYAAIQGFATLNTDVYDSVTVVRGATGLLMGAGDPSATVVLARKRPTEEFQAAVSQSFGSWKQRRTVGDVSGPLNAAGTLRGRVVGAYEAGDSWKQGYNQEKYVGYGALEADLGPRTMVSLALEAGDNRGGGGAGPYTGYALADEDGNPTPFGRRDNAMSEWSGFEDRRVGLTVALEHRFDDDWKVKLAYNRNQVKTDQRFGLASYPPEADGTATLHLRGYRNRNEVDALGIKLDGRYALFGRKHELVAGLNGSSTDEDTPSWYRNMATSVNVYNWNRQVAEPDWSSLYGFGWRYKTEQVGAYVATRLRATEPLSVLVGARVSNWRSRDLDGTGAVTSDREEKGVFTPYLGLVYDVTSHLSAYASYTTIFNPQSSRDVNNNLLDPEEGTNVELGMKGEWFGGRLNASLAVFQVKKDNLAVEEGVNQETGDPAYVAADNTKGRGWEVEVAGEPLAGWRVQGGYTRMVTRDRAGERLNADQPEHQFKLFTTWTPASIARLTVGGGTVWQSRVYASDMDEAWRDRYAQDDYAVVNLMARYAFTRQLALTVNLNNVFDKVYRTDLDVHDYGAPRNVYATLNYRF